jgi:flagellar basal body rod protein FlgC
MAPSRVSAMMSAEKRMLPRSSNISQRKSGMVRSFAPFRREHPSLSAADASRDGPLPAVSLNVDLLEQKHKRNIHLCGT